MSRRMGSLTRQNRVVIIASALIVMILAIGVFAYFAFAPKFGTQLQGSIQICYADGSCQTFTTQNNLWGQMAPQAVLSGQGGVITGLKLNLQILYAVLDFNGNHLPDKTVNAQYFVGYYIQVTGPAGVAIRYVNIPLFGTGEAAYISDLGTKTFDTNRYVFLANSLGMGPIGGYYVEKGSGLQAGNLNVGPDQAILINNVIKSGIPVASQIASFQNLFSPLLGVVNHKDGDTEPLISWNKDGAQFWTDMYSIVYPYQIWGITAPSGSACLGSTCFGAGAYLRMHTGTQSPSMSGGDQYTLSFRAFIWYRWQDLTGVWADWKFANPNLATINMQVQNGYYANLGVTVGGNVCLNGGC